MGLVRGVDRPGHVVRPVAVAQVVPRPIVVRRAARVGVATTVPTPVPLVALGRPVAVPGETGRAVGGLGTLAGAPVTRQTSQGPAQVGVGRATASATMVAPVAAVVVTALRDAPGETGDRPAPRHV